MTVAVSTLERRTVESLRNFARAQHVAVERHPDEVAEPTASCAKYRRYLVRRVPLEGICAYYQTYDASGDENDWNLNIAPDPAYAWMLDPAILYALSLASGREIDVCSVKCIAGSRVIECELTPDDGLYDRFVVSGLPIQSGGIWRDQDENQHEGPECRRVGVYGVFCGDFGHDGRPEIHPFDAFWRQRHENGWAQRISWDLGVFQDDSNRFNDDWSKAPIDVEFHIPFCLDLPVTLGAAVTWRPRFVLRRSNLCSVVAKNTRDRSAQDLTETFTARTVRFNPGLENRVELTVADETGVAGRPFSLRLEDVMYTTSRRIGWLSQAWVSGFIAIRVAIEQDGYAYWNFAGPNSTTAADAPTDDIVVTDPLAGVLATPAVAQRPLRPAAVRVTEARPLVLLGESPSIAAELAVTIDQGTGLGAEERVVTVRPRETPLIVDKKTGATIELESFDLFAFASAAAGPSAAKRMEVDISSLIGRLSGLEALGRRLRAAPATVEVEDSIALDVSAQYAPYREGVAYGEEESRLSKSLNEAETGPVQLRFDIRFTDAEGRFHRMRTGAALAAAPDGDGAVGVTLQASESGHRLVVGPLGGAPTVVTVEATVEDQFGLKSSVTATLPNYRVVNARPWVEQVSGVSLRDLQQRVEQAEPVARTTPTNDARSSAGMLRCLVGVLEELDRTPTAQALRVAGAVRLAARIRELMLRDVQA